MYILSCTISKLWLITGQTEGCLTLMPSLRVIACEYGHKQCITKNYILCATFLSQKVRCIFNHFYVIGPKNYWIWWNNAKYGHYTVQGNSRSPILVPTESAYATFYYWLIPTYLLSCTASKLWPIIGQIFASDRGVPHFNALAGVIPCEYSDKLYLFIN